MIRHITEKLTHLNGMHNMCTKLLQFVSICDKVWLTVPTTLRPSSEGTADQGGSSLFYPLQDVSVVRNKIFGGVV